MRTRIWEDADAMNVVSVLGFLMNDDGDVVGSERTQVLCKLLPSIHTLTHRAILAMLITNLSDDDAKVFYAENGLRVLHEWLVDGVRRKEPGTTKEKRRVEMFAQVRALLRILDTNVQTEGARRQNAYLCESLPRVIELLEGAGSDYAAEWSRLNLYRRHFESACGHSTSSKDTWSNGSTPTITTTSKPKPKPISGAVVDASARNAFAAASVPPPPAASSNTTTFAESKTTSTTATAATPPTRLSPAALLQYQPKSFLQADNNHKDADDDELVEYVDDDDDELILGEQVITNVNQSNASASLMLKIRKLGHEMHYNERTHCRQCRRMTAKRCETCASCVKCVQKGPCKKPLAAATAVVAPLSAKTTVSSSNLSVSDRNVQVLGSAMDQAIYKAFREEDFHAVFSLVQNGMDVNFQRVESDLSTALMAAAHHGRDDAVNKLLSLGANPCLKDCNNDTATTFAKRRGHVELMKRLQKCVDEWKG